MRLYSAYRIHAVHLKHLPVFQSHCCQLPSPHTAAVDGEELLFTMESKRGPMSAHDGDVLMLSMLNVEPREVTGRDPFKRTAKRRFHQAIR